MGKKEMTAVVRLVTDRPEGLEGSTTTQERSSSPSFIRTQRALDVAREPRWANEVVARLTGLLKLRPGWDSYRAPSLSRDAAMFSIEVLQSVMHPATPVPFVVPTSTGGVQLEWHQPFFDLEICISAPYVGTYSWSDAQTGQEGEGAFNQDLTTLKAVVSKVST